MTKFEPMDYQKCKVQFLGKACTSSLLPPSCCLQLCCASADSVLSPLRQPPMWYCGPGPTDTAFQGKESLTGFWNVNRMAQSWATALDNEVEATCLGCWSNQKRHLTHFGQLTSRLHFLETEINFSFVEAVVVLGILFFLNLRQIWSYLIQLCILSYMYQYRYKKEEIIYL